MTSHFGYSCNDQYEQAHHAVAIAKSHAALVRILQDDDKNKKLLSSSLCQDQIPSNNVITKTTAKHSPVTQHRFNHDDHKPTKCTNSQREDQNSTNIKKTKMAGSSDDIVPNEDINMTKCSACHHCCTNTGAQDLECCTVTSSSKDYKRAGKHHKYSSNESSNDSGTCYDLPEEDLKKSCEKYTSYHSDNSSDQLDFSKVDPDKYNGVYDTVVLCAVVSSLKDCDDNKLASNEDVEVSLCFFKQAATNDNSPLSPRGVKKLCEQHSHCGPTNYSQDSDGGYSTGCDMTPHELQVFSHPYGCEDSSQFTDGEDKRHTKYDLEALIHAKLFFEKTMIDPIALVEPTKLIDFNQPNIYCITVKSLLQSVIHHLSPINLLSSSSLITQHDIKHDDYGYALLMCGSLQEFWRFKLNNYHCNRTKIFENNRKHMNGIPLCSSIYPKICNT